MSLPRSLPNQITLARLGLALAVFVILHLIGWSEARALAATPSLVRASESGWVLAEASATPPAALDSAVRWVLSRERLLLNLGAAIFLLAAISDILDGRIARAWNLTTDFGRIADPFADKVIVSGTFLFLVPIAGSGVSAWMVVVIVARESLVDGLRGFAESRGVPFPASFWGKAKMTMQSIALIAIMVMLGNARDLTGKADLSSLPGVARLGTDVLVGLTVATTVVSGIVYLARARALLRSGASGEPAVRPTTGPVASGAVEAGVR